MDFYDILEEVEEGQAINPYASKYKGEWQTGFISIDFLNKHYGEYSTTQELIDNALTDGHVLYFEWLVEQGILN